MITLTPEEKAERIAEAKQLDVYKNYYDKDAFIEGYLYCALVEKVKASLAKSQDARDPDEQAPAPSMYDAWPPILSLAFVIVILASILIAIKFLK